MSAEVCARNVNEIIEPRVPFEEVPLEALTNKTKKILSTLLNSQKVLVNEDGYYRDWRGLFSLSGLPQSEETLISQCDNKTEKLLSLWIEKNRVNDNKITLSHLQHCLGKIDRWDVCDDISISLAEDAQFFLSKPQSSNSSKIEIIKADPDNDIVTNDDLISREKGLPLKKYDAFVMYHEKDVEFASELIEKCEFNGYSLCDRNRDFLGGVPFESEAILKLLSERCNRLIIIVSKAFLNSPMEIFITNYAQALGIEQKSRKIIPCLLEPCDLPQMLRFCFRLDFYRNNKLFNFWEKLNQSLKVTPQIKGGNAEINNRLSITEIDAAQSTLKLQISNSPVSLYDKDQAYKFTQTPTPTPSEKAERSSKLFFLKKSSPPEVQKPFWPPPPKLRAASSMVALNDCATETKISNKFSQSSFYLNQEVSNDCGLEAVKAKRRKWYKIFMPPKAPKVKTIEESPEPREIKIKRPWYKKQKKEKSKEKIAIEC